MRPTTWPNRSVANPAPHPESSQPVEHHPPVEEYLQTIESLIEEGTPVLQARIAERLGKSAPVGLRDARSAPLRRICQSKRPEHHVDQGGRAVAQSVIRKHRSGRDGCSSTSSACLGTWCTKKPADGST